MNVLVLGSGAREHALAWKIRQSPLLKRLWVAPGNPGMDATAERVALKADVPADVVAFAQREKIDLVVVGPEAPLVAGVVDALASVGILAFGPSQAAAALEGSKAFAKEMMEAAGVPTAGFRAFEDVEAAAKYAREVGRIVVKADGLAAGKGVVVAQSAEEAVDAVYALSKIPGAGQKLVLEELLEGEEVSVIALCDGDRFVLMPPARDHKRVGEGDTGPNTGGMGAFAPARSLTPEALVRVGDEVIAPMLRTMKARGTPFRGALYAGLMLTEQGTRVLEFNCRFGDPETQVLMLQLREDLLPLLCACAEGTLKPRALELHDGSSVGVVLASEGYPEKPRLGDPLGGLEAAGDSGIVFHAGTKEEGGSLVSSGGRVLTVCARGKSFHEARETAYAALSKITLRGSHFRRDIGAKAE